MPVGAAVDISDEIDSFVAKFDLPPREQVRKITLDAVERTATIEVYLLDDSGSKYILPADEVLAGAESDDVSGFSMKPAIESRVFAIEVTD